MPKLGPDTGRKGERTRAAIKVAIRRMLLEGGEPAVSVESICEEIGLTVGAFYFHFANKAAAVETVMVEIIGDLYAELAVQIERSSSPVSVIAGFYGGGDAPPRATLRRIFEFTRSSREAYLAWRASRRPILACLAGRQDMSRGEGAWDLLLGGLESAVEAHILTYPESNDDRDAEAQKILEVWKAIL